MTNEKTIATVAEDALTCFEFKKVGEKEKYVSKENALWREWVRDMVFDAHDKMMPDDYKYQYVVEALEAFQECETEDEAQDRIYELDADPYTADLTAWLASNINRVYYLEDAISNGATDGFQVLASAQAQERQEVAQTVLNHIQKQLEA